MKTAILSILLSLVSVSAFAGASPKVIADTQGIDRCDAAFDGKACHGRALTIANPAPHASRVTVTCAGVEIVETVIIPAHGTTTIDLGTDDAMISGQCYIVPTLADLGVL